MEIGDEPNLLHHRIQNRFGLDWSIISIWDREATHDVILPYSLTQHGTPRVDPMHFGWSAGIGTII
jgi:hypothetical protein